MRIPRSAALLATALVAAPVLASSHREAPGILNDPGADNTDLYAFLSPDRPGTVTIVSNWAPILEPNGGPNFYPFDTDAWFLIEISNDADAEAEIVYEFKFSTVVANGGTFLYNTGPVTSLDDPDLNVRQFYSVTRKDAAGSMLLADGLPIPPSNVGRNSIPDYEALAAEAIATLSDGTRVFAGERDDPFFVDLGATFDLLSFRRLPGDKGKGVDGLGGFNCLAVALQVPVERLTTDGLPAGPDNSVIGIWSTTERRNTRAYTSDGGTVWSGERVQVSRLGMPLVNELVIPMAQKNRFNASRPADDEQFLSYVVDPEPAALLDLLFGVQVPPPPRNDLVSVFLTGVNGLNQPAGVEPAEMLRLNMSIPPASTPDPLGVLAGDLAGFPNGRRLGDDVVDIELRAVAGVLVEGFNTPPGNRLGDGVDANDLPFLPAFPYLAPPHAGLDHAHHPEQHGGTQTAKVSATPARLSVQSRPAAARLEYRVERPGHVSLVIFDLQGRRVRTLVDQVAAAGTFVASWDGTTDGGARVGAGVYFARFAAGGTSSARKLVLQ